MSHFSCSLKERLVTVILSAVEAEKETDLGGQWQVHCQQTEGARCSLVAWSLGAGGLVSGQGGSCQSPTVLLYHVGRRGSHRGCQFCPLLPSKHSGAHAAIAFPLGG